MDYISTIKCAPYDLHTSDEWSWYNMLMKAEQLSRLCKSQGTSWGFTTIPKVIIS